MLQQTKIIKTYALCASDGDLGYLKEFYFDNFYWNVRYLGVDTGSWLNERLIVIPPNTINTAYKPDSIISVNVTRKQIEMSPALDCDESISRQYEKKFNTYYKLPEHHYGFDPETSGSSNLATTKDVFGYHIQALDGEIGHVIDIIIDMETWDIRYLLVDTKNWWAGKKVLISIKWIERMCCAESKIIINQSMEKIRQSAEFKPEFLKPNDGVEPDGHVEQKTYCGDEAATPLCDEGQDAGINQPCILS